jgi:polyhydroxybutyrate depolymerase
MAPTEPVASTANFERGQMQGRSENRPALDVALVALVALVVGLAVAVSACSSGSSSSKSDAATTTVPVRTCSTKEVPGAVTEKLTFDNVSRVVRTYVPKGYRGRTLIPLVVNLHGSGSTASQQEAFTGMDRTADANQFVVAYPQGIIPDGSGYDWNVPGVPLTRVRAVPARTPSDEAFLTQLVRSLVTRLCVDANRVYVTGFSGGGRLASQLACDRANTFAAAAPVAGLRLPTPCKATRPVPIIAFHGTADPIDPYAGHGDAYWTYSVPDAARRWGVQNGCSVPAVRSQPAARVTLDAYSQCRGNADVELYSIGGMGHQWPGGPPVSAAATALLGPQSSAVSANNLMWPFFAKHFRS